MAFSCEPDRSKAYSEDLRWRIVFKREVLGEGIQDISLDLRIDRFDRAQDFGTLLGYWRCEEEGFSSGLRGVTASLQQRRIYF